MQPHRLHVQAKIQILHQQNEIQTQGARPEGITLSITKHCITEHHYIIRIYL